MAKEKRDNEKIWDNIWNEDAKYKSYSPNNRYASYLIENALKNVDPKKIKKVYDMGCGDGWRTSYLTTIFRNANIIGMDISKEGVEIANKKYGNGKNLRFEVADIEKLKSKEEVDLIVSLEVLEHLEDWENTLKIWADINPKYMLLSFPAIRKLTKFDKKVGHFRHFKRCEVENVLKTIGYKKVKTYYAGFPAFWFIMVLTLELVSNGLLPETYDLLIKNKMTLKDKIISNITYFIIRFLSFKQIGCQFVGVFVKEE